MKIVLLLLLVVIMFSQTRPPIGSSEAFSNGIIAKEAGEKEQAIKWFVRAGQLDTLSITPWQEVMELSFYDYNWELALQAGQQILRIDPKNVELLEKLAYIHLQAGMYQDALIYLERLFEINPKSPRICIEIARVYVIVGRGDDAVKFLKKSMKHFENDIAFLKSAGDLYMKLSQFKLALSLFEKVLSQDPTYVGAYLGKAIIYEQIGKQDESEAAYREYFDREELPSVEVILSYLGLLAGRGQIDRAISECKTFLLLFPDNYFLHKRVAFLYLLQNKDEFALEYFINATEFAGDEVEEQLHLYIADILGQRGDIEGGIKAWEEHLDSQTQLSKRLDFWEYLIHFGETTYVMNEIDSLSLIYPDSALFDFFLGTYYFEQGLFDLARIRYENGLRKEPDNLSLYFTLGSTCEFLGERKKSIETLAILAKLDSENPTVLNFLGYILADSDTLLEYSRELLEKALQIDPLNGAILDSYGWLLFREGDLKGALEYLKKAEEFLIGDPELYEHFGDIYVKMEQFNKALEMYNIALKFAVKGNMFDKIYDKKNVLEMR